MSPSIGRWRQSSGGSASPSRVPNSTATFPPATSHGRAAASLLAAKHDMKLVLRLNGTSDLDCDYMMRRLATFSTELGVIRYDYTAVPNRVKRISESHAVIR